MTIRFDEPAWLWGLLLLVPIIASWWWLDRLPLLRRTLTVLLRSLAVVAILTALAQPQSLSTQQSIAVIGVLDVSGSMARFAETPPAELLQRFMGAAQRKAPDDRIGLVVFDGRARALMVPTALPRALDGLELAVHDGSSLADAVSLARALVPAGEAGRLLVMSDGLETSDRAERVAESVANGRVVIDTLLVPRIEVADVSIEGFDVPATALPGSAIPAVVTLRSSGPAAGIVRIRLDGRALPLRGTSAEGDGLAVELAEGTTTIRAQLPIGSGPVHALEVVFEPGDPSIDRVSENSRATRVIAVPAGRAVLALGRDATPRAIDGWLTDAGFSVRRLPADALPEDPLWLAGFDLILLDDVPAAQLSPAAQELLVDHVQRLGGGLLCTGGPNTFGPGGWRGSAIAELLPVEVEPPTERRRPQSAVVFVIDRSGSMRAPVAGARASQQEVANEAASLAIESIATRALVGVVAFDQRPSIVVPLAPLDDAAAVTARVRGISPDGGTAIGAALRAALDQLEGATEVDRRMVVLLTDGVGRDNELLEQQTERAAAAGIAVTTIAIGDSTDDVSLGAVAEKTGGTFRAVRNPRVLPRVLIESVQSINRPLLREGVVMAQPVGDSELARAIRTAPALGGVVILGRPRSAETILDAETDQNEPLVARWSAGVGRVALFASEASGSWSTAWESWPGGAPFWEQMARWSARSPASAPIASEARIEDGRFMVVLEAAAADAIAGATVDGIVRAPDGARRIITLQRVAPRRFAASIEAAASGAWLAILSPRGAAGPLPPILAAAVAPEGAEFERRAADPAPLEALRRSTSGRAFNAETLGGADLFTRDGLRLGERERSLAPELLALAALFFIGDTALRRLAVRRRMLVEATHVVHAEARLAAALSARRSTEGDRRDGAAVGLRSGSSTEDADGAEVRSPAFVVHRASGSHEGDDPRATEVRRPREGVVASGAATSGRGEHTTPAPTPEMVKAALAALRGAPIQAPPAGSAESSPSEAAPNAEQAPERGNEALDALRRARDRSRIFPP